MIIYGWHLTNQHRTKNSRSTAFAPSFYESRRVLPLLSLVFEVDVPVDGIFTAAMLYYYFQNPLSQRKTGNAHDDWSLDNWRRSGDRHSESSAVTF